MIVRDTSSIIALITGFALVLSGLLESCCSLSLTLVDPLLSNISRVLGLCFFLEFRFVFLGGSLGFEPPTHLYIYNPLCAVEC